MPYIIAIIVIVIFMIGFGVSRGGFAKAGAAEKVTSDAVSKSSRSEIEKLLKQIERESVPERKMGAMCYEAAPIKDHVEYICPLDSEKTVYNDERFADVAQLRRQVQQLNSVTKLAVFKLDETRLCHKCSPKLKDEDRYVTLVIRYPEGKEVRYDRVTVNDLEVLTGFFEKHLTFKDAYDAELPLKDQLPRIRRILGLAEVKK